ncbi:hypothetical protein M378DRAFT_160823, partial [Amanita muscaria Koide BX008]
MQAMQREFKVVHSVSERRVEALERRLDEKMAEVQGVRRALTFLIPLLHLLN